ncbi:MAG TPA: STAS domain-containing protein [Acidimicrobiales bacterium]|nr:STAS domain-containing protein [Acidimicrobiales bacterium]
MTLAQDFSIGFRRTADAIVVEVAGELDMYTAPMLRDRLLDVIDGQGNHFVAVDLSDVGFMDSTGIHVLVQALRRVRDKGGDLTLAGVPPFAHRVLEICGLTKIFTITA